MFGVGVGFIFQAARFKKSADDHWRCGGVFVFFFWQLVSRKAC